uniref:Replicase protein n=1 Tax=Saffron betaflexivirus 1 TaxID=3119434 RepID=A0AAU6MVR7_9VIRU
MATLSFRSPAEELLTKFTSEECSRISNTAVNALQNTEKNQHNFFNFAMSQKGKSKLIEAGIYLSPYSFVPHSHPICKTLENHILYNVLPTYVDNSFYFVGIKNNKVNFLKTRDRKIGNIEVINRFVTSLDTHRYPNFFVNQMTPEIKGLWRKKGVSGIESVINNIPKLGKDKNKLNFFFHDEFHYWSNKDYIKFLEVIRPNKVIGTVVFPPEILAGSKSSLNPWAYSYEISKGDLIYKPDNVAQESYIQPLHGGQILKTNRIILNDGTSYAVDILHSKFSHHLVAITRTELPSPARRFYNGFDAISLAGLSKMHSNVSDCYPIEYSVVSKLYRYLRTLRKPDAESAMAKLSQIVQEPTSAEIRFTEDFCKLVLNNGHVNMLFNSSFVTSLSRFFSSIFPKLLISSFPYLGKVMLNDFLKTLEPFSFEVQLNQMTEKMDTFFEFFDNEFTSDSFEDPVLIYEQKMLGEIISYHERSTPYFISASDLQEKGLYNPFFDISDGFLQSYIVQLISESFDFAEKKRENFLAGIINNFVGCLKSKNRHFNSILNSIKVDEVFIKEVLIYVSRIFYIKNFQRKSRKFSRENALWWLISDGKSRLNQNFLTYHGGVTVSKPLWTKNYTKVINEILSKQKGIEKKGRTEIREDKGKSKIDEHVVEVKEKEIFEKGESSNTHKNGGGKEEEDGRGEQNETGEFSFNFKEVATLFPEMKSTLFPIEQEEVEIIGSISSGGSEFHSKVLGVSVSKKNIDRGLSLRIHRVAGDGNCFWHSVGFLLGMDADEIKQLVYEEFKEIISEDQFLTVEFADDAYASMSSIALTCKTFNICICSIDEEREFCHVYNRNAGYPIFLHFTTNHFNPLVPLNKCVFDAAAEALNINSEQIYIDISRKNGGEIILHELTHGEGLNTSNIALFFEFMAINAFVQVENVIYKLTKHEGEKFLFSLEKNHLTFKGNNVDETILENLKIKELNESESNLLELTINLSGSSLTFKPSIEKAKKLSDSFFQGYTGVLLSSNSGEKDEVLQLGDKENNLSTRVVNTVLGTFGSGKSFFYKEMTKNFKSTTFTIISPRKKLCDMLRDDLSSVIKVSKSKQKMARIKLCTFEVFFKNFFFFSSSDVIILDEIQLFPPGFCDLVAIKIESGKKMLLCGDPCQSDYDSTNDRHIFGDTPSDIFEILDNQSYKYNILSRRFRNQMFHNKLPCLLHNIEFLPSSPFQHCSSMKELIDIEDFKIDVILVSSFVEKKIAYSAFKNKVEVMTFGESTGLTFNKGAILLTNESIKTSENRWITALSRFRENLCFVNLFGIPLISVCEIFLGRALHHFLTSQSTLSYFHDHLPGKPEFTKGFNIKTGTAGKDKEAKLMGDPWLKTMLNLGDDEEMEEVDVLLEEYQEECFKTHIPTVSLNSVIAEIHDKIRAKELREFRIGGEVTQQFVDDHYKGKGEQLTNAAERFETIYPRHRGTDTATFLMAVKKRLKFSNPATEEWKLRKARPFGKFLLDEFLKICPLKPGNCGSDLEEALKDFESKKLDKPAATIENHAGRSCRDWLGDVALIFMKSQLCTKYEKRFADAKAGQTLACFHHSVLCRFAPFIRYIEKRVNKFLPSNLYIHSGKNFDELNNFVVKEKFNGICTESDYEAFDASQDFYILSFELALMEFIGIPKDLILDYQYIKTHLGSKLGNFAIMRFTGEASTFLFNTLANMLFTQLRYDLNKNQAICFAGDDMCANERLKIKKDNEDFLKKISLKAKVSFTEKPTFCGWFLSQNGIIKNPCLVLERLCIARERNNVNNCIDSYAIEVSYAYKMGERLYTFLSESEMNAHHCCVRYLVKHKNLLKSDVKKIFTQI